MVGSSPIGDTSLYGGGCMKNSTNENDYRGFSNESYKYILNLSVLPFVFANKNYFKVFISSKRKIVILPPICKLSFHCCFLKYM